MPRTFVIGLVVLALVAVGAVAGQARTAPRTVVVPTVISKRNGITSADLLPKAYARLRGAGLRVSIPARETVTDVGCWPAVAGQSPRGGARVRARSVVALRSGVIPCPLPRPDVPAGPAPSFTVPSFVGHTAALAIAWASSNHLHWRVSLGSLRGGSAATLPANFRVTKQEPAAGSSLKRGPAPLVVSARQ
jgi:beta-lactam-binding protein with PASTA domain